jgi:hypothetical protein
MSSKNKTNGKTEKQLERNRNRRMRRKYPNVCGKVVKYIREDLSDSIPGITIQFTDGTSMTWCIRPRAEIEPELQDWKTGNGKILRRYPVLTTRR